MPQLPLFGDAPQTQPIARSRPTPKQRSLRTPSHSAATPAQTQLSQTIAPAARSPQCPIEPKTEVQPARSILPAAPAQAEAIAPTDRPEFDPIKHCRLCGAPIKHGGLDHSLCSGDCGWVVDLTWLVWMEAHRRKRKEPEPQSAAHTTDDQAGETLDLFTERLDSDTAKVDGGVA